MQTIRQHAQPSQDVIGRALGQMRDLLRQMEDARHISEPYASLVREKTEAVLSGSLYDMESPKGNIGRNVILATMNLVFRQTKGPRKRVLCESTCEYGPDGIMHIVGSIPYFQEHVDDGVNYSSIRYARIHHLTV